jgi:hypothetical protein
MENTTMKTLKMNMNLGTKLFAVLGSALLAVVVIGVVAVFGSQRMEKLGIRLYEVGYADLTLTADLAAAFQTQRALVGRAPAELDLEQLAEQRQQFEALTDQMVGKLTEYRETRTDAETQNRITQSCSGRCDQRPSGPRCDGTDNGRRTPDRGIGCCTEQSYGRCGGNEHERRSAAILGDCCGSRSGCSCGWGRFLCGEA